MSGNPPAISHPTDRLRLLLVEGYAEDRERLGRELAELPFVELAGSVATGAEALRRVGDCAPDAVLVAIQLPDQSGFDILRSVQESHIDLPVVLLSRSRSPFVEQTALALGAAGVCIESEGSAGASPVLQRLWRGKPRAGC